MKIIHCSDIHLDSSFKTNLNDEQIRERRAEILHTFVSMNDFARDNGVEAIIIAGDLFDTKNSRVAVKKEVLSCIERHSDITYYYLTGNHEGDSFSDWIKERGDIPANLRLFEGDSWTYHKLGDGLTIAGVNIGKADKKLMYSQLRLEPDDVNILTMHGQDSEYGTKDDDEVFSLKEFRNKNIDYFALGHIHSYREAELDKRGIYCYSGCLEGRGYDESGEKGFVLLDIKDNHEIVRSFVPFAKRKIHLLPIDISDTKDSQDIIHLIEIAVSDIPSADMVKIELEGAVDIKSEMNTDYIEQFFKRRFYTFKVKDTHVKIAIKPEDYIGDVSLKGEFIRYVLEADFTDIEKSEVIRLGLAAISGEEIG